MTRLTLVTATLLVAIAMTNSGVAAEQSGKWKLKIDESALDGRKTVLLSLTPEGTNKKGFLTIQCSTQKHYEGTHVILDDIGNINDYLDEKWRRKGLMMEYALDGGTIQQQLVVPIPKSMAVRVTNITDGLIQLEHKASHSSVDFIKILRGHSKFVFRIGATERIFDITGLDEAIAPVEDFCGVKNQ